MIRASLLLCLLGGAACVHDVAVRTEPPGALVVVDGVPAGPSPATFSRATGGDVPVVVEASAPGFRPARVVVHPATYSVPVVAGFLGAGALGCAGCVGASVAASALSPMLLCGVVAGLPILAVPSMVGLALSRKLPDTVVVTLQKEPAP